LPSNVKEKIIGYPENPRRQVNGALQEKLVKNWTCMRILLQHARTGLYLRGLGDWTANPYDAFDFQHSQKAVDYARDHKISGVQIAVRFFDSDVDEVAPLPPLSTTISASKTL